MWFEASLQPYGRVASAAVMRSSIRVACGASQPPRARASVVVVVVVIITITVLEKDVYFAVVIVVGAAKRMRRPPRRRILRRLRQVVERIRAGAALGEKLVERARPRVALREEWRQVEDSRASPSRGSTCDPIASADRRRRPAWSARRVGGLTIEPLPFP